MRHPEEPRTEDFSRDHTIWFIIWLKYFDDVNLALKIPKQVSDKFRLTIDQRPWIKAITKDRWIDNFTYWAIASTIMLFNADWNSLLRWIANIKSVSYKDFQVTSTKDLSVLEWIARKCSPPAYSLDLQAFMIHCMSDRWFKSRLEKCVIALVAPTNWHIRLLMRDILPLEYLEIQQYTGMDTERMGRRMDKTTDIEMNALHGPQPPYNMDVDLLHANLNY